MDRKIDKHVNIEVEKTFAISFVWSTILVEERAGHTGLSGDTEEVWRWRVTKSSRTETNTTLEVLWEIRGKAKLLQEMKTRKTTCIGIT